MGARRLVAFPIIYAVNSSQGSDQKSEYYVDFACNQPALLLALALLVHKHWGYLE